MKPRAISLPFPAGTGSQSRESGASCERGAGRGAQSRESCRPAGAPRSVPHVDMVAGDGPSQDRSVIAGTGPPHPPGHRTRDIASPSAPPNGAVPGRGGPSEGRAAPSPPSCRLPPGGYLSQHLMASTRFIFVSCSLDVGLAVSALCFLLY